MHAVTLRTVRCRPKFPAAFVAGQRRPIRNRPFHRTTRALKADDASKDSQGAESSAQVADPPPKDDNVAPNGNQNQPDPAPAVKLARGVEAAENNAEYLKAEIQAARKKIKLYSSQLSKVNGVNQASGIPPVHIPPWFLRLNVALHDEAKPGAPSDGKPKIEGSLCINGVSEEEEELLRLALPMPPKLWDALETTAKEKQDQKENVTNAAAFYSGFLQFINKYYRDAEGAKTENGSGPAKWKLKEDLGIHFSLYLETLTAMAGSLHAKNPENANSFPAAKSNLVLHCPVDGGVPQLEELVQDISAKLQADLVTLGPQDIAELVGEYVGEGSDLASQSLRYLGYQTHRSQFENMAEEEEFEDAEEEEGEESQEHTHPIPRPKGNGKRQAFIIQGFPARASFSDLFKAIDGRRPNGSMPGEMLGPGIGVNRPSSPQWDEIKLDASLKALLDAPSTKRTRSQGQTLESTNSGTASHDSQPTEVNTTHAEGEEKLVLGQTKSFRLTLDKNLQNVPKLPGPDRKRTVILIKDYKELSTTQHGGHIIDRLTDIVRKKREDGEEIMIVGITSSAELFPEVSRAGVRRMQAENETDFARTIVVPLGPITIDSLASAVDRRNETFGEGLDLTKEEFLRVRDINVRHIFDMIGQLDPNALDPVYADESRRHDVYERSKDWYDNEGKAIELTGPHLNRRVLAFHEVHRLAQTIVGLLRATTRTQHASRLVVQLAILLLRLSDDVKLSWATNERLLESARLSFKTMNATPKSETQSTLDAVAKSADKTEKKLLPGIVDPKAIKTTFDDVHVPDETKDALKTLISLSMQRPDAFKYGVLANDKMPGLLLYGPPGTGKTLLAKAVAKESGATVLQISASEIYEMWVGESEKNVRAVFSLARKLSPCVVFIDEADSLFGTRAGGKHKAHQKDTLNQFLKEWDGMNDLSVFIMVATNRPFDMDDAVLRRLPRRVLVDLPTEKDREAILRIHLKGEQLDEALDLGDIAKRTPFYSGSDLKNLCVAAALNCVKEENIAAIEKKKQQEEAAAAVAAKADAASAATTTEASSPEVSSSPESQDSQPPPTSEQPSPSSPTPTSPQSPQSQPQPQQSLYPTRRTLTSKHFEAAFEEIGASISEDMSSLVAIRKFDDQFGDNRNKNKKKKSAWGFQTNEWVAGEDSVRVRK